VYSLFVIIFQVYQKIESNGQDHYYIVLSHLACVTNIAKSLRCECHLWFK